MNNMLSFNPSGMNMDTAIGDPRRQLALPGGYANQGVMVSAPYAQANMMAAMKTNQMNSMSQLPVLTRVDEFLGRMCPSKG